ncbi:MAG: decarboxylating 6-phosphogluconate dehydrogenase [Alphaproteobacteria bacterium]|nr:decarboxylating 6-phosphogluconate dehydrogenase [Alphaproteobacteria bacterium]
MELGMVGLGRMGGNMALRISKGGHNVVGYDPNQQVVQDYVKQGISGASSLEDLVGQLSAPRAVWSMVPSGDVTEATVNRLSELLSPGDMVIDGGNSYYKDSMRRAAVLGEKDIYFMDSGTSGGIWGVTEGYSLMVGGDPAAFNRLEPILQTLATAVDKGYGRVGPAGAGHFVKMVHNGIEYGMMQAYAEGFEIMEAKKEFNLDMADIAEIWRYGSVVRSWLLDLTAAALQEEPDLASLQAYVDDSGEGRWTVQESVDLAVPAPVISASLQARFRSRQENSFGARLLAAMRNQFGGHAVRRAE